MASLGFTVTVKRADKPGTLTCAVPGLSDSCLHFSRALFAEALPDGSAARFAARQARGSNPSLLLPLCVPHRFHCYTHGEEDCFEITEVLLSGAPAAPAGKSHLPCLAFSPLPRAAEPRGIPRPGPPADDVKGVDSDHVYSGPRFDELDPEVLDAFHMCVRTQAVRSSFSLLFPRSACDLT